MGKLMDGDRTDLLIRCARFFYEEHRTKSQIAKELGVSGMQVKRLLDEAGAKGIVRVTVTDRRDFAHAEQLLVQQFGLSFARVTKYSPSYDLLRGYLGAAGAQVFEERVAMKVGTSVGIGGGSTLYAMVDALHSHPRQISIYPMALIGRGPEIEYVDSAFLATLLFFKSQPKARAFVVGMPPVPQDRRARAQFINIALRRIPEIHQVLDGARRVDIAFIGLGSLEPVRELEGVLIRTSMSISALRKRGTIGGINYNYFDEKGNQVGQFFLTISIPELRGLVEQGRLVILVAGGNHKAEAVRVALNSRMANGLVTDERTARKLVMASPLITEKLRGKNR